jgi:hypothetical protein
MVPLHMGVECVLLGASDMEHEFSNERDRPGSVALLADYRSIAFSCCERATRGSPLVKHAHQETA